MYKSRHRSHYSRSFKDHYQERKLLVSRSIIAFIFMVVMLFGLLVRSWYLQVTKYEDFHTRSNNNRISVQPLEPKRGLIYDRNGVLLAENSSVYSLEIVPEQVADLDLTLQKLTEMGLIEEKHQEKFREDLFGQRRFKSILLKNSLSESEVALFSVNSFLFPGVNIEARLIRHYPFAADMVHALGYVGRINDVELAQIDQADYKATRHIGKVGLEKYYEDYLHGTIGYRQVETDVQGRVIGNPLFEKPPQPGRNLKLSLDVRLQQVAASAIGTDRGSIVAIDPRNGDVLALVSNPGYDPNEFVTGISTTNFQVLLNSQDRPMFNRALRGLYSPGSTIKPLIGWAGLQSGLITTQTTISDPGYWILPNEEQRPYRDWNRRGHGDKVDLNLAIVESCDPYFYSLAYSMGIDTLHQYMQQFGFGEYSGIDMGEEVPGIMPSKEWKRAKRRVPWYPGETVITGIGQGYWIATPLQLANAIGQLGSGKSRYQLRLVNFTEVGNEWLPVNPVLAEFQADFADKKDLFAVQDAMHSVTKYPRGTAKKAFYQAGYESAGKTGTVQVVTQLEEKYDEKSVAKNLRDNAMYVGYAPYENPEIAIAVILENAGHGGDKAAPIARIVLDEYFKNRFNDANKTADLTPDSIAEVASGIR